MATTTLLLLTGAAVALTAGVYLSRQTQEAIVIPGLGITILVVAVEGGHVRIGIEAPPEVKILREELRPEPPDARPA